MLVIENFLTLLMLYAERTLGNVTSRQVSVKLIGEISLQALTKHGTVLGHGTPKFASQLPIQKYLLSLSPFGLLHRTSLEEISYKRNCERSCPFKINSGEQLYFLGIC